MEILNPASLNKWLPQWKTMTYQTLSDNISEKLSSVSLVKHIYGSHSADIDSLILSNPAVDRIFLLRRENREAAALSALIAAKQRHWNKRPTEPVGALPVARVRQLAQKYAKSAELAEMICVRSGVPYLAMSYEELFAEKEEARKEQAGKMLTFLLGSDASWSPEQFDRAFDEYLTASNKLSTEDVTSMVDNIDELEEKFPSIRG